jgi:histidine triad (HIT) family protein
LGHLIFAAHKVAEQEGVAEGYRLVLNNGKGANQLVQHVHFHIMAGRPLAWPPG